MKHNPSIAPIVVESERVIAEAIKHFGLKTKPANIVVTVQSKGRKNALGWFGPEYWGKPAKVEAVHEINLSAECISAACGETLIHELAHAENQTLGIKDCSNRIHNKHFKVMAERLGLEVKPRDKAVGFGFTDLGPEAKKFLEKIAFKHALFNVHRLTHHGFARAVGGTRLLKASCPDCGYTVRVTQKWIDVGLPVCPCGETLEVA